MAGKKRSAKDVLADLEAAGGLLASKAAKPLHYEPPKPFPHDPGSTKYHDDILKALSTALGVPKRMTKPEPATIPTMVTSDTPRKKLLSEDIERIFLHAEGPEENTFDAAYMNVLDPPPGFASALEAMFHPDFVMHCVAENVFYVVAPPIISRYRVPEVVVPEMTPADDGTEGDDFYLKPDWYETLVTLVDRGTTVLLIGPAGCGKTQAVEHIFKERGQRLEIVSCTPRTTANDLEGATDLVIEDGQQVTSFTPASPAIAAEKGYGLLLDEADAAPSEAMYSMYRLLDHKPMHIVRKGYEGEVPLHADFRVLGTQNTEGRGDDRGLYHGRAYQDEAFLDRWGAVIRVDYPTLEQEVLILRRRTAISGSDAENIVKAAQALRNSLNADEIMFTCTMRRTLAVAKNIASGFDPKTSWELAAINRATTEDRTKITEILNRIYGSKFSARRKAKKRKKPIAE